MTAAFTIILPHKRNPGNNAALSVALSCLQDNTVSDFLLIMDAAVDSPLYPRVNAMVQAATTDICVYFASDTFAAPGWDVGMLDAVNETTFVTGVVCEPGVIGINPENIGIDFGRTPEAFRRQAFEDWCLTAPVPSGIGFPAPYMFPRTGFLMYGGLQDAGLPPDLHGFTEADNVLFDRWRADGNRITRARSYFYHLQRYSQIDEQEAEKRK